MIQIVDQGIYNRRENLVFEGIHESRVENLQVIMTNLFRDMDVVFPEQIQVVRCHRLAGSHLLPKPIIIRFQWFQDRQRVWDKHFKLKGTNIFVKENFAPDTADKRRVLISIQMATKKHPDVKKYIITHNGKLILNSSVYTVDTLNTLPECLRPEAICVCQDDKIFVFKGRYVAFSNVCPAKFVTEGL